MSARDAESGSSTYKGGSGRAGGLGNGGIGGGMGGGGNHGGGMGGGAGRNGGIGNRTGLGTGTTMYGNSAFGRPGGMARGYGMLKNGVMTNMRNLDGTPMFTGPLSGTPRAPRPAGAPPRNPLVQEELAMPTYPPVDVPPEVLPAPPSQYPISIQGPGWTGPYGYWQNNPTNFPQYARDWEKGMWGDDNYYRGIGAVQPGDVKNDFARPNFNGNKGYY